MDGSRENKEFHADVPQVQRRLLPQGLGALRLGDEEPAGDGSSTRDRARTVMLAFDHGYFLGPTTGLERIDLTIVPLIPYADTLMLTRGISAHDDPARRTRGGDRAARQRAVRAS